MPIGIDNGLNGGICQLGANSEIITIGKLPLTKDKKEIDFTEMASLLLDIDILMDNVVYIEKPSGALSYKAGISMERSFTTIKCAAVSVGYKIVGVTAKQWQRAFWDIPKDKTNYNTKEEALKAAKKIWPNESFKASARSKLAHDGLVDAALIAEYGRTQ